MPIRPIEPGDRDLLAAGFERLSQDSRYRRFFAEIPALTDRQLDYLTRIDHRDHEALIAIDPQTGDAIGVARYVRTGPGVAEPAVVVADDWHRRGIGSALLDRLVERALEEGITRFAAPVLAENRPAIRTLERLGETTIERRGSEVELTIELRAEVEEPSSPAHALLRAVAAGTVEVALTFWHRIAPRQGLPREQLENVIVVGLEGDDRVALEVGWSLARARQSRLVLVAALLLDAAIETRARLIVVGDTGGDEGIAGRLLGSTWDHVSHHAPCDVLIGRR